MTIKATPAGADSNSYVTLDEADAILVDQRLHASSWSAADPGDKEKALIWSTMLVDSYYNWFGWIRTNTQHLRWPRSGVLDPDGRTIDDATIPHLLKVGVATLASKLIADDRMAEPGLLGLGFSQAKVGPLQVTVDSTQIKQPLPDDVLSILNQLGQPKDESFRSGFKTTKLKRV